MQFPVDPGYVYKLMAFRTTLQMQSNPLALALSLFIHASIAWLNMFEFFVDYSLFLLFGAWSSFGLCSGTVNKAFLHVDGKPAAKSSVLHDQIRT